MTSDNITKVQIIAECNDGQHLISVSNDKMLIGLIVEFCEFARLKVEMTLLEMAQWKDEQARQQRAKTREASKLSNRVQEMQNLLEWLYQNAPDVYDMAEKEIREWQNIASMKLNEELEKAEKEG